MQRRRWRFRRFGLCLAWCLIMSVNAPITSADCRTEARSHTHRTFQQGGEVLSKRRLAIIFPSIAFRFPEVHARAAAIFGILFDDFD
jgi:hypothetical protein